MKGPKEEAGTMAAGNVGTTIRPATMADAEKLASLAGQLGYAMSDSHAEERLSSLLCNEDHAIYIAEGAEGKTSGWIHIHLRELVIADRLGEIGGIVVDKEWRNQGVGRLLITAAEKWARDRGCARVYARSNALREASHAFYPRCGYDRLKTQRVYCKDFKTRG
jgi:GNAT superfamily N-acetyltransferase